MKTLNDNPYLMSNHTTNNKRIAKNTLMLYIRMLFLMLVNLYTSRVVLQALGVEDYGVYNAIAGFIAMFSMISSSIAGAISRFITFVLGQGDDDKLRKVFSTAVIIQLSLAAIVVVLVEAIGIWFLNTHMTIPVGREIAANWVLQFALITFVLNLWSTPYNAALIAHEKMAAFAYIGIFEGFANLIIAFMVMCSTFDRLIVYGAFMCLVALITRMIYNCYCKKHFDECSFRWTFDRKLFREVFGFAGWNFIGSISGLLRDQGINILFNIFCGPIINAARGLAIQVQTAVFKFSGNFYVAVQPQITKSYACNNLDESHSLVLNSSRLAFLLLTAMIVPLVTETDFVLQLWLKEVPAHTAAFVQIILICSLIDSLSTPLVYLMLATGNIKRYQIVVGLFNFLNFPVAWIILYYGGSPEFTQLSTIVFSIGALILRISMLRQMTHFPVREFLLSTVLRCLGIDFICFFVSFTISYIADMGLSRFILNLGITELTLCILLITIGLRTSEKRFILGKVKSYLHIQ